MNGIKTTLTTSGNSVAVRLPRELLKMSGLADKVVLEAKNGQIIISKANDPREDWSQRIQAMVSAQGDPTAAFVEMGAVANDGLDELEWNGPSYEDWLKTNDQLS